MPFLEFSGRKTFYNRVQAENVGGDQSALHFIFVHGLGSSHAFWEPIQTHLSKLGHDTVAFDTQGSGLSEIGTGEPVTISSISQDVEEIMKQLQMPASQTIAVGHSMGGIVVAELAQRCDLHGVVMVGPVLPKPALAGVFNQRIETVTKEGMEAMAKVIPSAATGSNAPSVSKAFIRTLLLSQTPEGYNGLCRAISGATRPAYENSRCALLVVAGEEDRTSPMGDCKTILDSWGAEDSQKRMVTLPGVGHWHSIEAPGEVSQSIEDFLGRISQRSS